MNQKRWSGIFGFLDCIVASIIVFSVFFLVKGLNFVIEFQKANVIL